MRSALAYAVANNALPVCAAGNSNSSIAPEPAYWYDCLSVIATDQNSAKASFSNYGVVDDVAAPGVAILSTMPTYGVTLNSYGYSSNYDALSGTSMATPAVAGIAGLVLSRNPHLNPAQVRGIIEAAAGDGASWTPNLGFGIVNAAKAVSLAIRSDNTAPTANLILPAAGATVSGLVTVQAAPADNSGVHQVDLVKDGTRLIQPLVGVSTVASTSTGPRKSTSKTTPAWTTDWLSTTTFNTGSVTVSVVASDVFGNSASTTRSFGIQNRLISQNWTQSLCLPATSTCPSSISLSVTTGVATQAATHLQGTVSYSSQKNVSSSTLWLQVLGSTATGSFLYSCGITNGPTVDCYPPSPFELYPDTKRYTNYSGAQIDASSVNQSPASEAATVQWTLTYPQ
jgi:hypothetical protein